MNYKSILGAVALSGGVLLGGMAAASTLTLTSVGCHISQLTTSILCEGAYVGNDSNSNLDGIFASNGWTEFAKVDASSGTDGFLTVTASSGGTNGSWTWSSVDGWFPYTKVMAVLKGGTSFSAYLLDLDFTSGGWNTDGLAKGNGKPGPELSHFALYWAEKDNGGGGGGPDPIPLPAAGWMMLAGLAGLAAARRRKA